MKPPSATNRANSPSACRKLFEPSAFDNASMIENENLIGIGHRRQAVRNDERRAAGAQCVEGALDLGLRLGIERARRLIEDQDRRILQDGARDGDALALAAGQ